jgi:hypothetical protein
MSDVFWEYVIWAGLILHFTVAAWTALEHFSAMMSRIGGMAQERREPIVAEPNPEVEDGEIDRYLGHNPPGKRQAIEEDAEPEPMSLSEPP